MILYTDCNLYIYTHIGYITMYVVYIYIMYYATGLVLKTLPSHSQDDAPLDAFAGTEKDVPELQHGGPAAEWLRIFPAARLSTCQSASASPPSPRPEEADKEKKKGGAALGLGSKKWCLCGNWTFTQLFVAFGIFWILGESQIFLREDSEWTIPAGYYQHVNHR